MGSTATRFVYTSLAILILNLLLLARIISGAVTLTSTATTVSVAETVTLPAVLTTFEVTTDNGGGLTVVSSDTNFIINLTPVGGVTANDASTVSTSAAGTWTATLKLNSQPDALMYDTDPATTSYTTTITLSDTDPTSTTQLITVDIVGNINDEDVQNVQVEELDGSTASVTYTTSEQTFAANTNIFKIKVDDADFDDTVSPITGKLQPNYGGVFDVTACTATGTYPTYECNVFITSGSVLNYEVQTEYVMELTLSDNRPTVVTATLTVSVTNEIDEVPSFETDNMPNTVSLTENSRGVPILSNETVFQVRGVNNEFDYNVSYLEYALGTNATNANGEELFMIDSDSGLIYRTTAELSFEDYDVSNPSIDLDVIVILKTDTDFNFTDTLTIDVVNICEPPEFLDTSTTFFRFDENEPTVDAELFTGGGTDATVLAGPALDGPPVIPYDIPVEDPDAPTGGDGTGAGHSETITYSIGSSANSYLFRMDCDGSDGTSVTLDTVSPLTVGNCTIEWASALDFEALKQRPTFTLNIIATDSCGATAEKLIQIAVRNTNDNPPIFIDTASYDTTIPENSVRDTYITTVIAYDPDADPDLTIQYSLVSNTFDNTANPGTYWFYIVTVSEDAGYGTQNVGKLYLRYPWDRDVRGSTAAVTVYARDNRPTTNTYVTGTGSTSSIDVIVTFSDVNDNRPVIHTFWNRELPYNEENGYDLDINLANNVTSSANDDIGANNDFEFAFLAPSVYFDINTTTGEIAKTNFILIPYRRYDVFIISYDLGTNPDTRYSPMGVVRIDSYERKDVHVVFHLDVTSAYLAANEKRFLLAMNDVFSDQGWFFRVYDYVDGVANLEVTLYALTSDRTQSVSYLNETKTYVLRDELISVTRESTDGTPTATLTNSTGGVLDDFNIELVEPEYVEPEEKENFWLDTELGVASMILIIIGGIVLLGLLAWLLYYLLTRERSVPPPPPPKPEPKPEPVLKQDYKRQGPGPQIIVDNEEDEFVSRPVKRKGAEMRGYDAVTGREYVANPVTGERNWVENEGDFY